MAVFNYALPCFAPFYLIGAFILLLCIGQLAVKVGSGFSGVDVVGNANKT